MLYVRYLIKVFDRWCGQLAGENDRLDDMSRVAGMEGHATHGAAVVGTFAVGAVATDVPGFVVMAVEERFAYRIADDGH